MTSDVEQKCVDWRMKTIEYLYRVIDIYDSEIQDSINRLSREPLRDSIVHCESQKIFEKSYAIVELKQLIYELNDELNDGDG